MPQIPTHQAPDFTPAAPSRIVGVQPVNLERSLSVLGDAALVRARDEAIQQAEKDALGDLKRGQPLVKRDRGMGSGIAGNEAYNGIIAQAEGMRKDREARNGFTELETKYEYDPEGFEKARAEFQTNFFKDVRMDDPKQYLEIEAYWNNAKDYRAARITANIDRRKKQQAAVRIGESVDQSITDMERRVYLSGYGESIDDELESLTDQIRLAETNGAYTPDGAAKLIQDATFKLIKANYLNRTNRGADVDALLAELEGRDAILSRFTVDQRQAIQGEVRARKNILTHGQQAERLQYDQQIEATKRLLLRGKGEFDPDVIGSMMRGKGYTDPEITATIDGLRFAKEIGTDVHILETGTPAEAAQMVEDARDWAENFDGTPLEMERAWQRHDELAKAHARMVKAYRSDAWGAESRYNPGWLDRYKDREGNLSGAGLLEAHKYLQWKTGDASVPVLPPAQLQQIRGQLDTATDSPTKATILGQLAMEYGRAFPRIAENKTLALSPAERLAGTMMAQGSLMEAQTVLIAEKQGEELEKLYGNEDANDQFERAFPDLGVFADRTQAGLVRSNFNNLYRHYLKRGLAPEVAREQAKKTLTAGFEEQDINGDVMLVPKGTNGDAINTTLDRIAENPGGVGLRLGDGPGEALVGDLSRFLQDHTRTQLVPWDGGYLVLDVLRGEKYRQQTSSGVQDLIIERDGTIRGVPAGPDPQANHRPRSGDWSGAVRIEPDTLKLKDLPARGGRGVYIPPEKNRTGPEAVLDTALRASQAAERSGMTPDRYSLRITRDPETLQYLNGVRAVIRSGKAPAWALEALGELGLPEFTGLRSEAIRIQVEKRFADPDQRTRRINGVRMSPLQVIKRIIGDVEKESINTPLPEFGGPGLGGGTWEVQKMRYRGDSPTDALMSAIRDRESRGKYNAVNELGMLGAYQFRAVALADLGYIRREALEGRSNKEIINDPQAWKPGYSKAAFLKDQKLQDRAMRKWLRRNLKELRRRGVIRDRRSMADVAGYLSVAHLAGVGGAVRHKRGSTRKDANGTRTSEYFDLGRAVFDEGESI